MLLNILGILLVLLFKKVDNMDYVGTLPRFSVLDIFNLENIFYSSNTLLSNSKRDTTMSSKSFQKHFKETYVDMNMVKNLTSSLPHQRNKRKSQYGEVTFDRFMRHQEINNYLKTVARKHSKIATIEALGKSYEGRDILALRISSGNYNRPTIFIDAGVHGREWIAPPVALYVIYQLVEVPQNSVLFQRVNWVIAPIMNPDGYEYTHEKERFWRKTRSKGNQCYGVDINRNFGFYWMATGASDLECSEVYGGPKQFSEVETTILGSYLWNNRNTIKLYVSLHNYGSYILYPWAFTTAVARNQRELHNLGVAVKEAIGRVYGTPYKVGAPPRVLYAVAGGSADYAKGVAGIELAYTIELPHGGPYGFDPPPSRIRPVIQETWEGIKVFHTYIEGKHGQS